MGDHSEEQARELNPCKPPEVQQSQVQGPVAGSGQSQGQVQGLESDAGQKAQHDLATHTQSPESQLCGHGDQERCLRTKRK